MSRKMRNDLVITAFALVVVTLVAILCPLAFDQVKRDDRRTQAEYRTKIKKIEADLGRREWLPYVVREGEGYNNAFITSAIRSELGLTSSDKYQTCVQLVEKKNHLENRALRAGKTLWVPCGTEYGLKTAKN